ncbi:hypothetical protein AgCh_016740 [Apium graveolens]
MDDSEVPQSKMRLRFQIRVLNAGRVAQNPMDLISVFTEGDIISTCPSVLDDHQLMSSGFSHFSRYSRRKRIAEFKAVKNFISEAIIHGYVLDKEAPHNPPPSHPSTTQIIKNMSWYEAIKVLILKIHENTIWKARMAMCLEATDPEYLSKIYDDPHRPITLDSVMSNRVIGCKTTKKIWDVLEVKSQGTTAIKKNRRTIISQEYEHFDSRDNKSLTEIYMLEQ